MSSPEVLYLVGNIDLLDGAVINEEETKITIKLTRGNPEFPLIVYNKPLDIYKLKVAFQDGDSIQFAINNIRYLRLDDIDDKILELSYLQ